LQTRESIDRFRAFQVDGLGRLPQYFFDEDLVVSSREDGIQEEITLANAQPANPIGDRKPVRAIEQLPAARTRLIEVAQRGDFARKHLGDALIDFSYARDSRMRPQN
jgi:hypothetical protein